MTDQQTPATDHPGVGQFIPGGPLEDSPEGVQDGDFGLGGDLSRQLVEALEKRWNADDPGATTLEDDTPTPTVPPSADTAATPVPAPDPATGAEPAAEDGGGGERAADAPDGAATVASDDTTPPAAATLDPASDDFSPGAYFDEFFGTHLTREQAQELAGMIGGLQALSPAQRARLDEVLARGPGEYPATMGQQPQQHPEYQANPPQPQVAVDPASDPAVAILGPRPDTDEYLAAQWDISARLARAQHQSNEALRADIARTTQMEMQRQQEANAARITAAEDAWRSKYPVLTPAEFDGLKDRAIRSGTFPALVAQYHGDVGQAVDAVYEQHFWADPALRQKAVANLASGRTAGDPATPDPSSPVAQQQAETEAGRRALASSVAGGGGSITPSSTSLPTDPDKKKQAMVQELASQHDFTQ